MLFSNNIKEYTYYYKNDEQYLTTLFELALESEKIEVVGDRIQYINAPFAFDIETTNIAIENQYYSACMYHWQFGMNGVVVLGRTWEDFIDFYWHLVDYTGVGGNCRIIVYVHNLQFEFQFLRQWLKWDKVFAIKMRRPLYALTTEGVEFRCSLLLSGFSLDYIGRNLLLKYDCKKLKGDLDYSLHRHSKTKLTDEEENYCINDVRVLNAYIQEKIEAGDDLSTIPLTNTGYVRRFVREVCFENPQYKHFINSLQYNDLEEFLMHRAAFTGGFTHTGILYSCKTVSNCGSGDITSSYPASALLEKYPVSQGQKVRVDSPEQFYYYLEHYCCVFDICFFNITTSFEWEQIIPTSKGMSLDDNAKVITNNGRLVQAYSWSTTITNVDFKWYEKFYNWESFKIGNMYIYEAGYLPRELIDATLRLYEDKTKLKGVLGKELEYLNSKGMLNSIYGMMVTNIIREIYEYEDVNWQHARRDRESAERELTRYNNNQNRFLNYAWGIFITAYSRARLWEAIYEFKGDYVYSDTDSVKGVNFSNHLKFFDKANEDIAHKIDEVAKFYHFDIERFYPKTIKGKEKMLGAWEIEHESDYLRFKSVGAKRYSYIPKPGSHLEEEIWTEVYSENYSSGLENFKMIYDTERIVSFTCAGVTKQIALPYLWNLYGSAEAIMIAFGEGFEVPPEYSGKLTPHFFDTPRSDDLVDYTGQVAHYYEKSGICLVPAPYSMSINREYMNLLKGVAEGIWDNEAR